MNTGSRLAETRISRELRYLSSNGNNPPDWLASSAVIYASSHPITGQAIYQLKDPKFGGPIHAYALELSLGDELQEGDVLYSNEFSPETTRRLRVLPIEPEKYLDWWREQNESRR